MGTDIDKQNGIFLDKLKNYPAVIVDTESPKSFQFAGEFMGF